MKLTLQYVNDMNGNIQAVQVPLSDWEKIIQKLNEYEQVLKLSTDLKEAFEEVSVLKLDRKPKQTLSEFLNEL